MDARSPPSSEGLPTFLMRSTISFSKQKRTVSKSAEQRQSAGLESVRSNGKEYAGKECTQNPAVQYSTDWSPARAPNVPEATRHEKPWLENRASESSRYIQFHSDISLSH
jgi:hypothetical protein